MQGRLPAPKTASQASSHSQLRKKSGVEEANKKEFQEPSSSRRESIRSQPVDTLFALTGLYGPFVKPAEGEKVL